MLLTSQVGWTAMMFACWEGHDCVVKTLLEAQASIDAQSEVSCIIIEYVYSLYHYSFVDGQT